MAALVIGVQAFLPLFRGWGGTPGLGKGILAFSGYTHYLMGNSALTLCIRRKFPKAFSYETRSVLRVNYSV